MDKVELICLAAGAAIIAIVILVTIFWRPFSSVKPSDKFYESGIGDGDGGH
ncbi:MAG TPA: hypothetical protein VJU34_14485 [Phenylobacterium sp.]|nr:hypothetical protein [Phenylobacterium sp.]